MAGHECWILAKNPAGLLAGELMHYAASPAWSPRIVGLLNGRVHAESERIVERGKRAEKALLYYPVTRY